jgi:sulfur-oxidizing protein SoxY
MMNEANVMHDVTNAGRRDFLRLMAGAGGVAAAAAAGLVHTGALWAQNWNKPAFESKAVAEVLKLMGAAGAAESRDIVITAPDIAENGAVVPVEVTSRIPGTDFISIIAEKNPFPLAASIEISNGAEPYTYVRIKMGETANVRAVVRAGGRYYTAVKEVKVTVGGCG